MTRETLTALLIAAALLGFIAGKLEPIRTAHAAALAPEQVTVELNALKSRVSQLETRTRTTTPGATTSDPAVAALQKEVSALTQVLQISGSGVTLKSPGTLTIQAGSGLAISAGAGSTIDVASSLKLRSHSALDLESAQVGLKATGAALIQGAAIRLNNGTKPAAFMGAKTQGGSTSQTIVDGSATVLLP